MRALYTRHPFAGAMTVALALAAIVIVIAKTAEWSDGALGSALLAVEVLGGLLFAARADLAGGPR